MYLYPLKLITTDAVKYYTLYKSHSEGKCSPEYAELVNTAAYGQCEL